jgi:hypothetical protein
MRLKQVLLSAVLLACTGCLVPPPRPVRQAPAPCTVPVAPIRYHSLLSVINVNYSYNAVDPAGGRTWHRGDVLDELNNLGKADGNSFTEPNGQQPNFYITYTITNDGQDHFTGSVKLEGWGQGYITTINKYQYPYSSSAKLVQDLTDDAYGFVHGGWHDSRPGCENGPQPKAAAKKK